MDKKYFTTIILILTAAATLLCGCYPKRVGPLDPEGKQLTWEQMDLSQRKAHMRQKVLPVAADVFGTWQPERFARVDCSLCHVQGETQGIYDMPTAALPPTKRSTAFGTRIRQGSGNHPAQTRPPGSRNVCSPGRQAVQHYHPNRLWLLFLPFGTKWRDVRELTG